MGRPIPMAPVNIFLFPKIQDYEILLGRINKQRRNMPQKLTSTTYKPPQKNIDQAFTIPSPMSLIWGLFSSLSNPANRSPSFEPNRYKVLSFNAESALAMDHIQKEFLPRFEFAEREIEKLTPSDPLSESLHRLYVLSLMERGIQKWNKKHQLEVMTTPKAVHLLYCKLFNKVDPLRRPLPFAQPKKRLSYFSLLSNPSKMNCFFNVALQTLFSNAELAASIVFSNRQFPEIKFAFMQYREAAAVAKKDPIDLATTLRMLYPCFNEERHHDASEALIKMIEPVERDRAPFYTLSRKTTYTGPHIDVLEGFYPDGSRLKETREAVYTLEVDDQDCLTLETLLFKSFNEVVTDSTPIGFTPPDGSPPVFLNRSLIETRYVSAPKFLIFNLSLGDINLQAARRKKKVTLVGLQRTFYLLGQLTLNQKGAVYRLLSFNVHKGDSATEGHYIHYRETPRGFFAISDDVSTEISETAYTIVLQRVDQPLSEKALYEGCLENSTRLAAMVLIFQTVGALKGPIRHPTPDQRKTLYSLTIFIQSLLEGEPSYETFKTLPASLRNLLLDLYSPKKALNQMLDHLNHQAERPLSIPKTYNEDIFSRSFVLIPTMADLVAKHLLNHPEKATPLKSHYDLIILSLGEISRRKFIEYQALVRRARVTHAAFLEIGQILLTCGVTAAKLKAGDKAVTIETLRKDSTVVVQILSSLARVLLTRMDPFRKNKYLQLVQQLVAPALTMAQHRHDQGIWSFSPLLSSAFQLGLSHTKLSEPTKALTANFAPLVLTDVLSPSYQSAPTLTKFGSLALSRLLPPNGRKELASRLSALYSSVPQLAAPQLEHCSDPDHILTSPKGWSARAPKKHPLPHRRLWT